MASGPNPWCDSCRWAGPGRVTGKGNGYARSVAATDVPIGNTYDKYASQEPHRAAADGRVLRRLDAALPADAPRSILEVGVGEAEVADRVRARYPEARFVGIDLPDPELAAHWARPRADRQPSPTSPACRSPTPSFDLVLAIEVLEHVPDPPGALRELARLATGRPRAVGAPRAHLAGRQHGAGQVPRRPGQHPRSHQPLEQGSVRGTGRRRSSPSAPWPAPFPWTMVAASAR